MEMQPEIPPKSMKNSFIILCIVACFAGCSKHNNSTSSPQIHEFKGIVVINDVGQEMGTWGTDDGDWENDPSWSAGEYGVLDFPDTISLNGTFIRDTSGWNIGPGIHEQPRNVIIIFPNPLKNNASMYYGGLGLLKFKAAIVDKYFNRLYTFACKDSMACIHLDFSDSTKFQNGTLYRFYYSLSATDSLHFYKGHGDILLCRENTLQDCQKFVP